MVSFNLTGKTKFGRKILRFFGHRTLIRKDEKTRGVAWLTIKDNSSSSQMVIDEFLKDGWIEEF